jgi:hypothetical protein
MASGQGSGTKVSRSGKVVRAKQTETSFPLRCTAELSDRFQACCVLDARIHGGDVNYSSTLRRLMVEYCNRIERTAASEVATEGAKVLRRKAS